MQTGRARSARLRVVAALSAAALVASGGAASAAAPAPDLDREAAIAERLRPQSFPSQWWWDESEEDTERARDLLRRMTLDEKVNMMHGELNNFYGFYNGPIERLGIPALTMADGPAGVRIANPNVNGQRATQLPAPIAPGADVRKPAGGCRASRRSRPGPSAPFPGLPSTRPPATSPGSTRA